MRVNERMRKALSILLCLCMLLQNAPVMVFAATTDNLCDHHTEHTAECGYREGSAGSACTHAHSEDCYEILECLHACGTECELSCNHECTVENGCITMELDCHHVHGNCGYSQGTAEVPCGHVHSESCGYVQAVAVTPCANAETDPECDHSGDCGYVAAVEGHPCGHTACDDTCGYAPATAGFPCTHTHAVKVDSDNSCYKLLCSHKDGGHDNSCGYLAPVSGSACTFHCRICHVQELVDALPGEVTAENAEAVAAQLTAIDNEKASLSDEELAQVDFTKYTAAAKGLGSVYAAVPAADYTVAITDSENGSVTASAETVAEGAEVILTATPADGYELDTLQVTYGEGESVTEVAVTDNKFTMPAANVTVTATFKEKETTPVCTCTEQCEEGCSNSECVVCGTACAHEFDSVGLCNLCDLRKVWLKTSSWEAPTIFCSDTFQEIPMTKDTETELWYGYVPKTLEGFIFRSLYTNPYTGNKLCYQTDLLSLPENANCYRVAGSPSTATDESCTYYTYGGNWYFHPCTEHTWESGQCSLCGLVCSHIGGEQTCDGYQCQVCGSLYGEKLPHNFYDGTGKCLECGEFLAVLQETNSYRTIYYSLDQIASGCVFEHGTSLKLLADIHMEHGACLEMRYGEFTLDLNGYTLYSTSDHAVYVCEKLTVMDSSSAGNGQIRSSNSATGSTTGYPTAALYGMTDNFRITVVGDVELNGIVTFLSNNNAGSGTFDLTQWDNAVDSSVHIIHGTSAIYSSVLLPTGYGLTYEGAFVSSTFPVRASATLLVAKCNNHVGGEATCSKQAECTYCGESYGELAPDNHSTTADGDSAATCTAQAYCSACQSEYGEMDLNNHASEEFTYIANEDGTTHKKMNKCCEATVVEAETHTFDATTGKCTACGTKPPAVVVTAPVAYEKSIYYRPTNQDYFGLMYCGSEQELVTGGSAEGGTMVYSLDLNGEFTETVPTAKNAGTYTVYYKVLGDETHSDTNVASVTVTMEKAPAFIRPTNGTFCLDYDCSKLTSSMRNCQVPYYDGDTIRYPDVELTFTTDAVQGVKGEYTIFISGPAEDENYIYTYENGTLSLVDHYMYSYSGKCVCGLEMAAAMVTSGGVETYYETLMEALTAAGSGDTVTLCKSVDIGSTGHTIPESVTFQGGEYTVSGEGDGSGVENHGTIASGKFTFMVENNGTVVGGEFEMLINSGTVEGGSFKSIDCELGSSLSGPVNIAYSISNMGECRIDLSDAVFTGEWRLANVTSSDLTVSSLKLPEGYAVEYDGAVVSVLPAWETGNVVRHTHTYETVFNSTYHWTVCACGKITEEVEHSYTYTDNGDGTHDKACTACDAVVDNEAHTPAENATYTNNGDGTHSYTCSSCGNPVTEAHTFTDSACTGCGVIGGYCGEEGNEQNVIWTYANGTLTVSGTGAMADQSDPNNRPWEAHAGQITTVVVNDGITSIGEAAFSRFKQLTTANLPNSLTTISQQAFQGCAALKTVNFPANLKTIEGWAFEECYALESVTLPEGLTTIGFRAFSECIDLKSVTVPASVTTIEEGAFGHSPATITVTEDNLNYSSDEHGVLFDKDKTTLIYCRPNIEVETYTIPSTVTEICKEAFYGCKNLAAIIIPKGVTTIGQLAFSNCEALTAITIPAGVTTIEFSTFSGCTSLTTVTIPASVTTIGTWAFSGCEALTTVNVPCTWDDSLYTFDESVLNKVHNWVNGTCTVCRESCDHTGGEATCTTQAVCDICGESYGEVGSHAPAENATYTVNDNTHSFTCAACGTTVTEAHTIDAATGKCVCGKEMAVAKVDDTYYADFAEALAAWTDGTTLTLLDNISTNAECEISGGTRTLDLNGKTWQCAHTLYFTNAANVTITDSTPEGKGVLRSSVGIATVFLADTSVLTLAGGTVYGVSLMPNGHPTQAQFIMTGGTLTERSVIALQAGGSLVTISGGTVKGEIEYQTGVIDLSEHDDPMDIWIYTTAALPENPSIKLPEGYALLYRHSKEPVTELVSGTDYIVGCGLSGSLHGTAADNGDGTHSVTCTLCGVNGTENHTLTYTANGNIITAACSANCGYSATAALSAENETYNGTEQETATVAYSENWMGGELIVSYENNVNAGTAAARITIGDATASVEFTIAQKTLSVNSAIVADKSYDGSTDANVTEVTFTGMESTDVLAMGTDFTATAAFADANAGTDKSVTVTVTLRNTAAAKNYRLVSASVDTTATISPKSVPDPTITLSFDTVTYTGQEHRPTVTVMDGNTLIPGDAYTVTYTNNVNAGTANVRIEAKAGSNYTLAGNKDFTIERANAKVTAAPTANNLAYTGEAQALIRAGTATGGTMQYSLDGSTWSTTIPTGKDAGKYTVCYKVAGDSNHKDTAEASIEVTIAPKTVNAPVIEGVEEQYLHTGSAIEPTVKLMDGTTEIPASEYTVAYSNNTAVGTATITIMDNQGGNYTVSGSATFRIVQHEHVWTYTAKDNVITAICSGTIGTCPVADSTVTLTLTAPSNLTYDGQERAVTVVQSPAGVFSNVPAVTYSESGNINAGTHTASLTYGGKTATLEFTIAKADQTAPTGLAETNETIRGLEDGTITGLTNKMEYAVGDSRVYTAISGNQLENLAAGTYRVRYAADTNHNPGADAELTIAAGKPITVKFANGSVHPVIGHYGLPADLTGISYDAAIPQPTAPADDTGDFVFLGWYTDAGCTDGNAWDFTKAFDAANVVASAFVQQTDHVEFSLYAKWKQIHFTISANVIDSNNNPYTGNVDIQLVQGNQVIETKTNIKSPVTFGKYVDAGIYNIIVTYTDASGEHTKTELITVQQDANFVVQLPPPGVNSHLSIEDGAPNVIVGGLDRVAQNVMDQNQNSGADVDVAIEMEVAEKTNTDTSVTRIEEKIEEVTQNQVLAVDYLDITLTQTVTVNGQKDETALTDTGPQVIRIVIPFNFSGKDVDSIRMFRYHDHVAQPLTKGNVQQDGYFWPNEENGTIDVYATKFSTYAIAYAMEYKVTLNANGGSVSTGELTVQGDGTLSNLPEPTRDGYVFKGWYTAASGGTKVTTSYVFSGNATVYAQWSGYTVTVAGTSNGTVSVDRTEAPSGTQITITVSPKSGYKMDTITVKDANGNSRAVSTDNNGKYYFTMPNANVTVTATFSQISTATADPTNPKTGEDFEVIFWSGMMMTSLFGMAVLVLGKQKIYQR